MKTNNPNSIETAAWGLACKWWEVSPVGYERKLHILVDAAQEIGKLEIIGQIRDMLPRNMAIEDSWGCAQMQVKYVDEVRRLPDAPRANVVVSGASGREVPARVRAEMVARGSHEVQNWDTVGMETSVHM